MRENKWKSSVRARGNVTEHRQRNWNYISDKWAHVSALWQQYKQPAVLWWWRWWCFHLFVRLQLTSNNQPKFAVFRIENEERKKIQTLSIRIILKQRQPKYKHSNNNKNITPIKQNKYQSTRTTTNLNCIPCMIHGRMGDRGKEKLNNKCISANEVVFCV